MFITLTILKYTTYTSTPQPVVSGGFFNRLPKNPKTTGRWGNPPLGQAGELAPEALEAQAPPAASPKAARTMDLEKPQLPNLANRASAFWGVWAFWF